MIIPLTGILFERAFLNEVTASSRSLLSLFSTRVHLTGLIYFKDYSFVCNPCGNVILLNTIFISDTFFRTFSFFNFFQSFIFFCYRNVSSFHLSYLFRRILLFMQDKNFVILNIRIFLKFLEEDIALLTLQKSVLLVLSQVRKGKVNLVEKLVTAMNEELPIVTISSSETF